MGLIGHSERNKRIQASGAKLEKWFESFLLRYIPEYDGSKEEFMAEIGSLGRPCFKRSVDLGLSEYGAYASNKTKREGNQLADFVIGGLRGYPDGLRVECKRQDTYGSADEKLCYTVANIERAAMPAWIGWVGTGWKNGAIERTEAQVAGCKFLNGVYEMEVVKEKLVRLFA